MKFLCFVIVSILGVANAAEEQEKDHNGAEHKALCGVLREVVGVYQSGSGSEALRKVLKKTIFGNEAGGDLETLKGLPSDYDDVLRDVNSRNFACGQPRNHWEEYQSVYQPRWSGHSAPHDLVCLCTTGTGGFPINGTGPSKTLCGKDETALKAKGNKGWDSENTREKKTGIEQINATWVEVVTQCLKGGTGKKLEEALKTFLETLVHKFDEVQPNRYQLGAGEPTESFACSGSSARGVCVLYYNSTTAKYPMPWWTDLQKAIPEEERFQQQKKREEEEKRKQKEGTAKKEAQKTEALKSGSHNTNQTEQNKTDTLHETMRKLNLTRSSSISRPSSWLLNVVFLF